jgi:hypothetical protein
MVFTRRRLLLLIGLAFLCLLALGIIPMLTPGSAPGITKVKFDRIEKQMMLAEVQEIFGQKGVVFHGYVNKSAHCWEDGRSSAIVVLDEAGKVETAKWEDTRETLGEQVRRLLRWPWW